MKRVFYLFILLLLAACNSTTPTSQVTALPPSSTSVGYPEPGVALTSYPGPVSEQTPTQGPTLTPDSSKGNVTGTLLLKGAPLADARLYLADILKDAQGKEIAASFDPATSPVAFTGNDGAFAFVNINPGRYSLVYNNSITAYMLYKPGTQDNLIIEVSANQTTDCGSLNYDDLPVLNSTK